MSLRYEEAEQPYKPQTLTSEVFYILFEMICFISSTCEYSITVKIYISWQ
jgi:hypothetical protein